MRLNTDYLAHKEELDALARQVVYTGPIDAYFGYRLGTSGIPQPAVRDGGAGYGQLSGQWRWSTTPTRETPYTRIIEHKHFEFGTQPKTVISREYPAPSGRPGHGTRTTR